MVICHFRISIVKDNEKWLYALKYSARMGLLALGSNRKTILGPREEKSWTTLPLMIRETSMYVTP
jgi:hypothetical protein